MSYFGVFSGKFYTNLEDFQSIYKDFLGNKHEFSEKEI
jgi:hypothetical protein